MSVTRLFAQEPPPSLQSFDLLAILGGPMSVNDGKHFDWFPPERRFVHRALEQEKRVLGICLGAQLIASVLGAKVFPNTERETGWFPVRRMPEFTQFAAIAALPEIFPALHWHGETFDLPPGATWLAQSEGCRHQAISVGPRILGLQFHLESTLESVEALMENCPHDLAPGRFVQTAPSLLNPHARFKDSNRLLGRLLERFTESRPA